MCASNDTVYFMNRHRNRWEYAVAAIVLMASQLCLFAASHGPRIACDSKVYDFGRRMDHNVLDHSFAIENRGDTTLVIEDVYTSCGCTVASIPQRRIPPGKSSNMDVEIVLSGRRGEFEKEVEIVSNDESTPSLILLVRGEVIPSREIKPRHLFLRKLGRHEAREATSEITFNAETQYIGSVSTESDLLETDLEVLEPGHHYRIHARTIPPLKTSKREASISVRDRQGKRLFTIPVWFQIVRPIHFSPQVLEFDRSGGPDELAQKQVVIRKGSAENFEIEDVHAPDDVDVDVVKLGDYGYRVHLKGIDPGDAIGESLIIETDVDEMNEIVIPCKWRDQ